MADDPHAQPTESERLQLERARLECEKLRAEIAQGSQAWWKRPANLASVATLAALLTGWVSGYFPSEREKLQGQIRDLEGRMAASRQDAMLVNSDLDRLRAERDDVKTRARELTQEATAVQQRLSAELDGLRGAQARATRDLKAVQQQVEATQRRIDEFYLRLKVASANAAYALSHYGPIREQSAGVRAQLARDTRLPGDLAEPVKRMLADERVMDDVLKATARDLDRVLKELQTLPASPWALRLRPHPDGRLYEPDGTRYYDLTDRAFHDAR